MPYYITENSADCSSWAVVKEDGELIACHDTKESAIDQAVAISIAEDEPFEGERAAINALKPEDYVSWDVLNPEILAEVVMVEGEYAVIKLYDYEDGVFVPTDKMLIINVFKLEIVPRPTLTVEEVIEPEDSEPDEEEIILDESRAINEPAPAYMRAAARRGLEYYEQGLGGDGLVERTIREARAMAEGDVSDDKWIRIAAWIARHLGDLDAPDADPNSENYPSAGVVAHLLWGSGPSKRAAERTLAFAESVVARIRAEQESERMTETISERDKWIGAAWAIKAKIEGLPDEARSIGKNETRINTEALEIREDGDGMTFEGYAAVFNSDSEPLPFIERIAPGAFKRSLQSRNEIKLLWNHDAGEPLASVRGGTLKLTEDDRGLKVQARLANTTKGRDVAELIRSKTIDSMSFGFSVIKDSWSRDGNQRTLESVRLHEVSLVSWPAYEGTAGSVSVRSSRNIDADQLADSLMKLELGEELDPTQASLINEVVAKLTKTEEVQEVEGDILALKKKKLDLLMKGL
jgi:HK97 family phage prohead protease